MSKGFSIDHDVSAGLGPQSSGEMYASEEPNGRSDTINKTETNPSAMGSELPVGGRKGKTNSALTDAIRLGQGTQAVGQRAALPTPDEHAKGGAKKLTQNTGGANGK